jgi:hypothetical protein
MSIVSSHLFDFTSQLFDVCVINWQQILFHLITLFNDDFVISK